MYLKETAGSQTPEVLALHQLSRAEPSFLSCLIWFLSLPAAELAGAPNTIACIYTCLSFTFMEFYQCNVYPLYSPKVFPVCFLLLLVCLLFKSNLVWFKLLLLVKDKNHVSFFCRWYPVFPIPFVEWNILSPICILNTAIENYLIVKVEITLRPSILVFMSVFMSKPCCCGYQTFEVCIWSQLVYSHLFFSFWLR